MKNFRGVQLIDKAMATKAILEERRLTMLEDFQVNEWGENLDELQETYTKRVGLKRASSLNLDMIENPTDSRRRQNSVMAVMTINDDITKLELTEGVREAGQYVRAHELRHTLRAEITAPEEVGYLDAMRTKVSGQVRVIEPVLNICQGSQVVCARFNPGGHTLVTGDKSCEVRIWTKGKPGASKMWRSTQVLKEHMAPVMSLAFVPAGELGAQEMLITAAGDWTVRMWQRELGVGKYRPVGKVAVDHSGWVLSMCYISKEACMSLGVPMPILVTASGDKTLKVLVPSLFNAKELVVCATLTGHTDVVYHVTYAKRKFGGHLLIASAAVDWTVKIWRMEVIGDPRSGWICESQLKDATSGGTLGPPIDFHPVEPGIIVSAYRQFVKVWELSQGDVAAGDVVDGAVLKRSLEGHVGELSGVAFRRDGVLLASSDMDGDVRLWHAAGDWECLVRCSAGHRQARAAVFGCGESAGQFMCSDETGRVRVWDTCQVKPLEEVQAEEAMPEEDGGVDLDVLPSYSRSWGGSPRMGRLGSPGALSAFGRHSPKLSGAHGRLQSSHGQGGGRMSPLIGGMRNMSTSRSKSPGSPTTAAGVVPYGGSSGLSPTHVSSPRSPSHAEMWSRLSGPASPSLQQAITGEGEGEEGEGEGGVVVGGGERKDSVGCVVFIGGEEDAGGGGKPPCVAAGSYDEAVILWDMRSGLSISRFYPQEGNSRRGVRGGVTCMCLVQRPSASYLVSGGHGGFVKTLPVDDEERASTAKDKTQPKTLCKHGSDDGTGKGPAHRAAVTACASSPDGAVLVTAGEDGVVLVWNCKEWVVSHQCAHGCLVTSISFHMPDCAYFSVAGGPLPGGGGDFLQFSGGVSEAGSRPGTQGGAGSRPGTRHSSHIRREEADEYAIYTYNVEKGIRFPRPQRVHDSKVLCMAYSIDGEHFASCASGDPNIALSPFVDMKSSDLAATQQPFQAGTLEGHSGEVICLAYSSLGLLASAGSDSEIRLWAPSPQPGNLPTLTAVLADNACIWKNLNFSSGGLLLFAGGSNQVASWQLTPPPKPKPTTSVNNASSTARRSSQAENATKSFRARSAGRWEAREGRSAMQETHFEGRCRARLRLIGDGLGLWEGPAQAGGGDLDGEGGDGFGGLGGGFMMGGGLDMGDAGDGDMGGAGGGQEENPAHAVGWERSCKYVEGRKLAVQLSMVGRGDPQVDLDAAFERRKKVWRDRKNKEAEEEMGLSDAEKKRLQRRRMPGSKEPPPNPLTATESAARRERSAVASCGKMAALGDCWGHVACIRAMMDQLESVNQGARAASIVALSCICPRASAMPPGKSWGNAGEEVWAKEAALVEIHDEVVRFDLAEKLRKSKHEVETKKAMQDKRKGRDKRHELEVADWKASREYGAERRRMLANLAACMDDFDAASRRLAPHLSRSVVAALVQCCYDGDARVREATMSALCLLAPVGDRDVIDLACQLIEEGGEEDYAGISRAAILCIGAIGPGDMDAVYRLTDAAAAPPPKGGSAPAPVGSGQGGVNSKEVLATLEEVRARLSEIADSLGDRGGGESREEEEAARLMDIDMRRRKAALEAIALVLRGRAWSVGLAREPLLAVLASLKDEVQPVRMAALAVCSTLYRGNAVGLPAEYDTQDSALDKRPPFQESPFVRYDEPLPAEKYRGYRSKPGRRGVEPHTEPLVRCVPPSMDPKTGKEVLWQSTSGRPYGETGINVHARFPSNPFIPGGVDKPRVLREYTIRPGRLDTPLDAHYLPDVAAKAAAEAHAAATAQAAVEEQERAKKEAAAAAQKIADEKAAAAAAAAEERAKRKAAAAASGSGKASGRASGRSSVSSSRMSSARGNAPLSARSGTGSAKTSARGSAPPLSSRSNAARGGGDGDGDGAEGGDSSPGAGSAMASARGGGDNSRPGSNLNSAR